MQQVVKVEVEAIKNGIYTVYVFRNLNTDEYLMCTRLPNWEGADLQVGQVGFLSYNFVKAGDPWFNNKTQGYNLFSYTNNYFEKFVHEKEQKNDCLIIN